MNRRKTDIKNAPPANGKERFCYALQELERGTKLAVDVVIIRIPRARGGQANLKQILVVRDDDQTAAHAVFLRAIVIGGGIIAIVAVRAADAYGAARFIFISTDKAVNPTSVMGATKRMGEMIVQYYARTSKTIFTAVRFGNVLGSNGSVIPVFQRQIAAGGPVTVTHPDIERFFMTIPEASRLVIQAGGMAHGGEIFILDMGEPVKIVDLAKGLIQLQGLTPDVDIKIEFTGLREGEKMYEELLMDEESTLPTDNQSIMISTGQEISYDQVASKLDELENALSATDGEAIRMLEQAVPTYHYTSNGKGIV